jgi:membrane-bound inhibitor of C-type lysozyme
LQKVDYQCAAQRTVSVEYPQPEVEDVVPIRISWHGRHYRLVRVSSASGARYASQQLVWWNKGEQSVLLTRGGRTLARDCQPLLTATTAPVLTPVAP